MSIEKLGQVKLSAFTRKYQTKKKPARTECESYSDNEVGKRNSTRNSEQSIDWRTCSAWNFHRSEGNIKLWWDILGGPRFNKEASCLQEYIKKKSSESGKKISEISSRIDSVCQHAKSIDLENINW